MRTAGVNFMRRKNAGVTLMELLVVIAIVGLLAGIAIPSYRNYVIRANRADGKAALLSIAGALERCYTRFNSYTEDDGCAVPLPANSTEGKYTINATTRTATTFTLATTPVDGEGQEDDTDCGNFTLTNTNLKGVTGATRPAQECWRK
jgi:type IV pilus assembly protein PilE